MTPLSHYARLHERHPSTRPTRIYDPSGRFGQPLPCHLLVAYDGMEADWMRDGQSDDAMAWDEEYPESALALCRCKAMEVLQNHGAVLWHPNRNGPDGSLYLDQFENEAGGFKPRIGPFSGTIDDAAISALDAVLGGRE